MAQIVWLGALESLYERSQVDHLTIEWRMGMNCGTEDGNKEKSNPCKLATNPNFPTRTRHDGLYP